MDFAILDIRRLRERSVKLKLWRFIMVNGIGSNSSYMNYSQTNAVRSRPDPAEMFSKVDTDGSGGISQTELESFVTNMSNKTGKSVDSTNGVSTYDKDGNGELSQDELKSFMEATMAPPGGVKRMGGGQGHKDPFNSIDSDSSGGVSQSELETFLTDFSGKTGQSIDSTDAVTTYDTDGNGELSQDELKSFMDANNMAPAPPPPGGPGMMNGAGNSGKSSNTSADSIISAYDKNGDGALSSDELQGYLDETETNSASFMISLLKQAISAYSSNSGGSSSFDMSETYFNFSEVNEYTPVDLSV
jgi:Ca2+-binding EF-hand superfamily protein